MIKEHDCVVLTQNIPEEGLEAGDVVSCEQAIARLWVAGKQLH